MRSDEDEEESSDDDNGDEYAKLRQSMLGGLKSFFG